MAGNRRARHLAGRGRVVGARRAGREAALADNCLGGAGWSGARRGVEGREGGGHPRKVDIRLPGKGNSNPHGARPVY